MESPDLDACVRKHSLPLAGYAVVIRPGVCLQVLHNCFARCQCCATPLDAVAVKHACACSRARSQNPFYLLESEMP